MQSLFNTLSLLWMRTVIVVQNQFVSERESRMCRPLRDMPPYDAFLHCGGGLGGGGGGEAIGVIHVMIG
jgi:hypothetical protein